MRGTAELIAYPLNCDKKQFIVETLDKSDLEIDDAWNHPSIPKVFGEKKAYYLNPWQVKVELMEVEQTTKRPQQSEMPAWLL